MRPLCMHYNLPAMSFPFIFHSHSVLRVAVPLSIGLKAGGGTWDRLSVTYCHALMNKFTLFHTLKHPEVPPCWQTAPWATTFSALLNDLGPVVVLMHSPDIRAITYFLFIWYTFSILLPKNRYLNISGRNRRLYVGFILFTGFPWKHLLRSQHSVCSCVE